MKYLGLDLGTKTLGLAISNGLIATSLKTIRYEDIDKLILELEKIIKEYDINCLVLGFPKNMNGTIGPQAEYCLKFKGMLEETTNLEVIMIDERLTSRQADVIMLSADMSRNKRKKNVDKLAATIILQTYLDQKR